MAGENENKDPKPEDSAETEDSLSGILRETAPGYTGHPAEEEEKAKAPEEKAPEEEEVVVERRKADTPSEEKESETEKEKEEKGEKETPSSEEAPYKTLEDAQKSVTEAKRRMHEATTEAAELRKSMSKLQEQMNDIMAAKLKENQEKPLSKEQKKGVKDLVEETFGKIGQLDTTNETYQKQVAEQWETLLNSVVDMGEQKILQKLDSQKREEEENRKKENERVETEKYADKRAKEYGLDMGEESTDRELFWAFAKTMKFPEGSTIDKQVELVSDKVKTYKVKIAEPRKNAQEKADKAQRRNQVLEKSGAERHTDKKENESPIGIGDALRETQRRI